MSEYSSSNRRIAKNTLFLSIRMVIVLAISLYTTRVVLQVLGVVDYGVYNVVCGFVAMFSFLNTSMSNGIQRFYNYEFGRDGEDGANRVYCTAILIQLLLTILVVILTEVFGLWYLHNKMVIPDDRIVAAEWVFQFSILSFVFVIMQAPYTAAVMAHERMDFYAVVNVLDSILKLGIVFMLPFLGIDKLVLYGILMACISAINFALYFIYTKCSFPEIHFHSYYNRQMFRSMLSFSGWNLFGSFSGVMKEQGINLVINYFFGPVVNAARGIASQINGGIQSFVVNITMPVRPQVVQSYARGDLNRAMNLTYSISKLSCCFLLLLAVPASLEIDYILHLWLGGNIPEHAGTFAIIILTTSIINNLNAATSGIVHATGVMKDYQLWGSLISMSSVPIAYLILAKLKIPELALVSVFLCSAISHFVCLIVVRRLVGISLMKYLKEVIWPIFIVLSISVLITAPFHFFFKSGFLRLIIVTIVGGATVLLTQYYLAFNNNERQLFTQMLNSLLIKLNIKRL